MGVEVAWGLMCTALNCLIGGGLINYYYFCFLSLSSLVPFFS